MPMLQPTRPFSALRDFFQNEASGGLVLMASAVLALCIANSPLAPIYFDALKTYVGGLSILHWINDGLMALFFLLVGLEIKREMLEGQLRTWPDRILPGVAAAGGMVVPALVYAALNWHSPDTLRGWAIPAATDIAFALGVMALLGPRVPVSLKVFLMALAIIDDLGAVLIIAFFYTANLNLYYLGGALLVLSLLCGLNALGWRTLTPFLLLGAVLWFLVLKSGVHATIAGVLLAMTIPLRSVPSRPSPAVPENAVSPLHRLEHALHPWSSFIILPIFGFANAGVAFSGVSGSMLLEPATLGIAFGLLVGKQIGVFGAALAVIKLGWAKRPAHSSWSQLYGTALLCGIGFTMSLFIGPLAFANRPELETETKIGVFGGSLAAMAVGAIVLLMTSGKPRRGP